MKTHRVLAVLLILTLGLAPLLPAPESWALASAPESESVSTADLGSFSPAHAAYLLDHAPTIAGTPTTSAQARQSVAQWTLMVYMAADNDLERYALSDLNEMEIVGSTTEMNIVVQIDRSAGYDTSDGDWAETRRYFVTRDRRLSRLGSEPVDGFSQETNTGDPATLSDFAIWAMSTYPAQQYGLIIWDHGGSWLGVATDDSAEQDDLILPELDSALAKITGETGRDQLDLVGFDACLMGAFEVYQTIAPYARFGIGSAELIPGNGWDYMGALSALAADPAMTGDSLGRAVVDSFMTFYTTVVTSYPIFNLAVIDLAQTASVASALEALNQVVSESPESATDAIVAARSATPEYGAFNDPQYADVWAAADLIQFLLHLRDTDGVENLSSAASAAADAAQSLLIYYRSSTDEGIKAGARAAIDAPANAGVSIYFPHDAKAFLNTRSAKRYTNETPAGNAQWNALLTTLFNTALATLDPSTLNGSINSISGSGSQADISLDPSLSALSRAALVVLLDLGGGQSIVIDYSASPGSSTTWNGLVPYLTNGQSQIPVLVLRNRADSNMGIVNGRFMLPDGSTLRAQLVFDLTTNQLLSVWGMRPSAHSLMPFELVTESGDLFQPSWITLTRNNRLFSIPAGIQLTVLDTPFRLVWQRAPAGAYHVTLLLNDAAGNAAHSTRPIALTGDDDDDLGLVVLDPDSPDMDGDGLPNDDDNCPANPNPDQVDTDEDEVGDACDFFDDRDLDGDGVARGEDNCLGLYNPDQADSDGDGIGDACGGISDSDGDGIPDDLDNCPDVPDAAQFDDDFDGIGNECDPAFDDEEGDYEEDFWGFGLDGDLDGDGIEDELDNCPLDWNPDQIDSDDDGIGDACFEDEGEDEGEQDIDADGIDDWFDNCTFDWNPDQADSDDNGLGDACDEEEELPASDMDGDGVDDSIDNCPFDYNPDQADSDSDGVGDACPYAEGDLDLDDDGVADYEDNCPGIWNPDQADIDDDGFGDVCQPAVELDSDGDGVADIYDNCPTLSNTDQTDDNENDIGDACEEAAAPIADMDGDSFEDSIDNCPFDWNPDQADDDANGIGDACDTAIADMDGDGVEDSIDNCPSTPNPDQIDANTNGIGDLCDSFYTMDTDGDGVGDGIDNCPSTSNPDQADSNGDGVGDACTPLQADISATVMVDNPAPAMMGDPVNTQLLISNSGPNDATNIGYTWTHTVTSCMDSVQTVTNGSGTIASLMAGEYTYINIATDNVGSAGPCSSMTNGSASGGTPPDPNPGNDSSSGSFTYVEVLPLDTDGDGWIDDMDNCPLDYNPDQMDSDSNGIGDACDAMANVGVSVMVSNPSPSNGEVVTFTISYTNYGPSYLTAVDYSRGIGFTSCQGIPGSGTTGLNPLGELDVGQTITQTLSYIAGDTCDATVSASVANAVPKDLVPDNDSAGASFVYTPPDSDGDGVSDLLDNCPGVANLDQFDTDGNGQGDACDPLADLAVNVSVSNPTPGAGEVVTFTISISNTGPNDATADYSATISSTSCGFPPVVGDGFVGPVGIGPIPAGTTITQQTYSFTAGTDCHANVWAGVANVSPKDWIVGNESSSASFTYTPPDADSDGVPDASDNCPIAPNTDQTNSDSDGLGDACDNCPAVSNPDQADSDFDGAGDACDPLMADIGVSVTVSNPSPANGDTVDFWMNITNNGPNDASNITYGYGSSRTACWPPSSMGPANMDTLASLPAGQTYSQLLASMTVGQSGYCSGSADASILSSTPLDTNTGNNNSAASFSFTPPDGDSDGVPDWADNCPAVSNSDQLDTDSNGQGDACDPVTDIGIVVTASNSTPVNGELVTFTMTITNHGPANATNIGYSFGYSYTICSPPSGGGPAYMGSPISLNVGQSYTSDLVSFTAGTYCSGTASASLGGSTPRDWTTGNNSGSASFTFTP